MHLKRSIGLAVIVAAVCVVLIGTAGAASGPQAQRHQTRFTSAAGALAYLKAHGIPTRGIVIQRGHRNYAGPSCPGRRWRCSKARRVIQFDAGSGSNQFTCSPSYGGTGSAVPPDQCVIVQVSTSGNNSANCTENSSAPGESESCLVTQQSTTGNNKSKVTQVIDQRDGQSQSASQFANVDQTSGTGRNDSDLSQTIIQHASDGSSTVDQNQNATQSNETFQNSTSGTQNSSMSQSVKQLEHAGGGADPGMSVFASPDDGGPVDGLQNQSGDGTSDTSQSSSGVSTSSNDQSMQQRELAPNGSTVVQDQFGPFRCCSPQTGNPKDKFTLKQSKLQMASTFPQLGGSSQASLFECECSSSQFISENGSLESDGSVSINQTANQNGNQTNNSCTATATFCDATIECAEGVCTPFECSDGGCGDFSLARYSAAALALRPTVRLARRTHHFG